MKIGDLIKINIGDGITRAETGDVSDVFDEVVGVYLIRGSCGFGG